MESRTVEGIEGKRLELRSWKESVQAGTGCRLTVASPSSWCLEFDLIGAYFFDTNIRSLSTVLEKAREL